MFFYVPALDTSMKIQFKQSVASESESFEFDEVYELPSERAWYWIRCGLAVPLEERAVLEQEPCEVAVANYRKPVRRKKGS